VTPLKKKLTRLTQVTIQGRKLVVQLEGPMLRIKQQGRHNWYGLPLASLFWHAAKAGYLQRSPTKP